MSAEERVAILVERCRIERERGCNLHWTYSQGYHRALIEELRAARQALAREEEARLRASK